MSLIGKIRIKSFGTVISPENKFPKKQKLDVVPKISEPSLEEYSRKRTSNDANALQLKSNTSLETCNQEPLPFDVVDLTSDTFVPSTIAKNETKTRCSPKKALDKRFSVEKAPKKQRKSAKQNVVEKTTSEITPPRKFKKLSLRRNILSDLACGSMNVKVPVDTNKSSSECKINHARSQKLAKKRTRFKKIENQESLKKDVEPTVIPGVIDLSSDDDNDTKSELPKQLPIMVQKLPITVKSEKSICPSYKVIQGTTFAVDGFKFGRIEGVTAYFLSHFHSDHYIGLTRKFSMPIYVSQITANLMREFIPLDEQYVNILPLHATVTIENVHVTAIDANHCPGAVMFLFELPCGKRILHTGDFRASAEMESNPFISQRNIDLLYLDTTYISHNYSFQTQEQSVANALSLIREFKERNQGKRVLYVVGTYLVGKEKFWMPIANEFNFRIWTDSNRKKVMQAIDTGQIISRLVDHPQEADMHIVSITKIGFKKIQTYWEENGNAYDMLLAIRPSGWEKNSKPYYRGSINLVGIEYSEHSSYSELRRFLRFLKPLQVISTVPYGKDLTKCPDVPLSWYREECLSPIKKQTSMLDYFTFAKNKD